MTIKGVFFDLDDTLHDHLAPFSDAIKATFNNELNSVNIEILYKSFRHFSDILWKTYTADQITLEELRIQRIIKALESFHFSISRDKATLFQKEYENMSNELKLFTEVPETITSLEQKGLLIGIITNGPFQHQINKIKMLGLDKIVPRHNIFISDAVGIAKPNPKIFSYVCEKTCFLPNELIYVGDTWANDVVAPIEAGWHSIWFNHRNRTPETNHKPDAVVEDIESLNIAINLLLS
ncbi:HAD family hydrolase [Fredinandcohnia sp. 179-A 10B2 NHS]|uniref:HAD family hydrolase n=1 Tax=Fredinandcohnia sp. 179-A 10B2 NHS TaxID=3235176 RepID=UPI0039A07E29